MNNKLLITGTVFGITAIALGAFAAHGLKELLSVESMKSFETGVRYQMYHALLCLLLGSTNTLQEKFKKIIFYLLISGVFMFSGSIYLLATNDFSGIDFRTIGFVTPIGGLLLITAWGIMCFSFINSIRNTQK